MTDQELEEIKARHEQDLPDIELVDAATRSRIEDIAALLAERRTFLAAAINPPARHINKGEN